MNFRTDLALERRELIRDSVPNGVDFDEKIQGEFKVTRIEITSAEGEKSLNKPRGNYVTVEFPRLTSVPDENDEIIELIANELKALLTENGTVLVVGLGNRNITPDAIGPKTVEYTLTTRHVADKMPELNFRSVAAVATGVMGQTGIESSEIVKSICDRINPSCVIVVDALASMSTERLCKTVQLCDTGISPGSGVGNKRSELSQNTLGVKTIAVGVPTVVDAETVAAELAREDFDKQNKSKKLASLMVTPQEIDSLVTAISRTLSLAIGRALQPSLSVSDLYFLTV